MKKRIEKLEEIKKSEEVIQLEEQVAEKERTLHVINKYKTSYEKMDLDRILFNLNVFYRKNLDVVNEAIQKAIENVEKEFAGNGRVLIRPSGTEPLVRVMIEGENQEYITKRAKEIAELLERKLK